LQLFVEIGFNGLPDTNLGRQLDAAEMFGWDLIRVMVGETGVEETLKILGSALPRFCSQGITLGLEDHFDPTMDQLPSIVRQLGDEHAGTIIDSTNGMGFPEEPQEVIVKAEPCLVFVRTRDHTIRKPKGRSRLCCDGRRIGQSHAGSARRPAPPRRIRVRSFLK
jgi:hypothetical protein